MNVSKINAYSFSENPFKENFLGKIGWNFLGASNLKEKRK